MYLLTSPTNLGNRPYESDGTARQTDRGPARLRELGMVERLGARDLGDVPAPPYRDFVRPPGGVAGMDLALVTGRGDTPLAQRLVRDEDVIAYGIRDGDVSGSRIRVAGDAEEVVRWAGGETFFIHVDADVLDPAFMPYVDSPEPGGLTPDELTSLLARLAAHPRAVGMELTIYDPRDDRDGRGARLLLQMLEDALRSRRAPVRS